jgi:predicted nucleic acid-binding protein
MPKQVVIDTGPLVALFNRDDNFHGQALRFVQGFRGELLTTMAVVTEVMYLLAFSLEAQKDFLRWITDGALTLIEPERTDLQRVILLLDKYSDLPMDSTDGLLVATCERLGLNHVATVDEDFTIYRFKGRGRFVNVFQDEGRT